MSSVLLLCAYPPGLHHYGIDKALRQAGLRVFTAGPRGPLAPEFENAFQQHEPGYGYDLLVASDEPLDAILARCPFQPDFILYLESGFPFLPRGLAEAPCPTLGLFTEEHLHADWYGALYPYFDVALCTWRSTEVTHRAHGRDNVQQWYFGARPGFCLDEGLERIWDVAFVGNLNPQVQRRRLLTVEKILRLRDEGLRIHVACSVFFRDYNRIHCQSKIVYHDSITEQVNMRVFEAMAAGCLVIMRRPRDMSDPSSQIFRDREEIVYCDSDEEALALIRHYARHEDERRRVALAGCRKVITEHNYLDVVGRLLRDVVGRVPPDFREARRARLTRHHKDERRQRLDYGWYYGLHGAMGAAVDELRALRPDAEVLNTLGVVFAIAQDIERALRCLELACTADPSFILARVNRATAGLTFGRPEASRWCEEALEALSTVDPSTVRPAVLEGPFFPCQYDRFRLEVAATHLGYPSGAARNRALLALYRCRLHALRGQAALREERPAEALADVERALAIIDDDGYLLRNRGWARLHVQDLEGGLADLRRAIELEPFFASARLDLAQVLDKLGCLEEAYAEYASLVHHNPLLIPTSDLWRRTGELALALHKPAEARAAFVNAEQAPDVAGSPAG